ncbi:MAG: amino acid adenylation domain-containing protein [Candidatus Acidiferrales bacterium]
MSGFLRSAKLFPSRPAIEVGGAAIGYEELRRKAASIAATLQQKTPSGGPSLTAVFAYRSATAYAGVLGTLMRGHGYVPLNRTFPPARTKLMLSRAGCRAIVADAASADQLDQILDGAEDSLLIILPEIDDVNVHAARWPKHTFVGSRDLEPSDSLQPEDASSDSIAYLLFTSGSTGVPKGVMVAHRNVRHFVDVMVDRYGITEHDRFSQTFDMTFDLSAFDMFVAWERGACVCCPSQKSLINPGKFIQDLKLTVWFSVPSVGLFMKQLGGLKPGRYPDLRWSLFCGEALPIEIASAWTLAAPNSHVENLYGPTELTIACMLYKWDSHRSPGECCFGVVPIGKPYPGMETVVVDESLKEVQPGEDGELLMAGPQLSLGYWQDSDKTAAAFIRLPGIAGTYYRTGDRVRRPIADAPFVYLGRMDLQVKVQGHRVELGEVESALKEVAGLDLAVALGWPVTPSGVGGVVCFITDSTVDTSAIIERLKNRLPSYIVPREIYKLSQFPLNSNGKVDRKALLKRLEEET